MTSARGSATADGQRFETLTALVDGSNLAYDGSVPRVARLQAVRWALDSAGFDAVEVVCDANLRHRFDELNRRDARAFQQGLDSGLWAQSPARVRADEVLLRRLDADPSAVVVSNDAFAKDEDDSYRPDDLPQRHIRVHFQRDGLQLLYPDGWQVQGNGWFATRAGSRGQAGIALTGRAGGLRGASAIFVAVAIQVVCLVVLFGVAAPWVEVPRSGAGTETRTDLEIGYITGSGLNDGRDGLILFVAAATAILLGFGFYLLPRPWLAMMLAVLGGTIVVVTTYNWLRLQLLDPEAELARRLCNPACVLGGPYFALGGGLMLTFLALGVWAYRR